MKIKSSFLIDSLKIYYNVLGNWIFLSIFLALFVATLDIAGISLFVPIIQSVFQNAPSVGFSADQDHITSALSEVFTLFSIPQSNSYILLTLFLFFIIKSAIAFTLLSVNAYLKAKFVYKLRINVFETFLDDTNTMGHSLRPGQMSDFIGYQIERCLQGLNLYLKFTVNAVYSAIYAIGLILLFSFFVIYPLMGALSVLLIYFYLNKKTKNASLQLASASQDLSAESSSLVRDYEYFSLTSAFRHIFSRIKRVCEEYQKAQLIVGIIHSFAVAIREPLLLVLVCSIAWIAISSDLLVLGSSVFMLVLLYRCANSILATFKCWQGLFEYFGNLETVRPLLIWGKQETKVVKTRYVSAADGISIENVNVNIQEGDEILLSKVNFGLQPNSLNIISGKSGSGKSTLLKTILGKNKFSSGRIRFLQNNEVANPKTNFRVANVGYIPQSSTIFEGSVSDNITLYGAQGEPSLETNGRIQEVCAMTGVDKIRGHSLSKNEFILQEGGRNISGGEKKRLMIARELIKNPDLLVLDEPTSGLDPRSAKAIYDLLNQLSNSICIVCVTHDPTDKFTYAHQLLRIADSKVVNTFNLKT